MAVGDAQQRQVETVAFDDGSPSIRSSSPQSGGDDYHTTSSVKANIRDEQESLLSDSRKSSVSSVSSHDDDHTASGAREAQTPPVPRKDVSWSSLPHKDQLLILTLARLAEPLFQNSLSSYVFFMLQSFDPSLDDSQVSTQAGILIGGFTLFQALTAVWWGRMADLGSVGRKNIIIVGLIGSFFSSIGFGFSKSFWGVMFFRCLGGALNGNVGIMRTMISELVVEKKYQPKAFLILPGTFNFGVLVGPLLGGWLQDPVNTYPRVFGPGSKLGGDDGVAWMIKYPYALANLVNAAVFLCSIILVLLGLQETHVDRKHQSDPGLKAGEWLKRLLLCRVRFRSAVPSHNYVALDSSNGPHIELSSRQNASDDPTIPKRRPNLPYRRIFTSNVLFTMLTHGLLHINLSAFNAMWFLFLSTPRFNPKKPDPPMKTSQHLPFAFTGGLGLPPSTIGLAIGIIGVVGLFFQFGGIYTWITFRLGIITTHRLALLLTCPIAYFLVPYLAVIPTTSPAPEAADGAWIWIGIFVFLTIQTFGRTFVLPITQILVNNCTPHPSTLASVHGIGQTVSSGCRTLGPVIWSSLYGYGLEQGVVGIAWWALGVEALAAAASSWLLREGSGHEIVLDGDEQD